MITELQDRRQRASASRDRIRRRAGHNYSDDEIDDAVAVVPRAGASHADALNVVEDIAARWQPDRLAAYIRGIPTEDLTRMINVTLGARQHAEARAIAEGRADQPQCHHGERGGACLNPLTGEAFCPFCRRGITSDAS